MNRSRRVAGRQPISSTRGELAAHGIEYCSDDRFKGCAAAADGSRLHFGQVRLTEETLPFWRYYRSSSGRIADLLAGLSNRLERSAGDRAEAESLAADYGWSRRRAEAVAALIRRRAYGSRRIFRRLKGGVTGIEWLLDEEFASTEDRFVSYVARSPFEEGRGPFPNQVPDNTADLLATHTELYAKLLITVGVATAQGLPTTTHFGIFRNPLAFLEDEPAYRGLAMPLHGFSATVALHAWTGKVFMTTNPMPRMQEVLLAKVASGDVHIADSDADLRAYINRNLPPGLTPVKEGRRLSFAGHTAGAKPIVVKLLALSKHYQPMA